MLSSHQSDLDQLRGDLQQLTPATFEHLIAALVGSAIGVPIAVAKSGFQHGADAGTAGRQGRRLRVETKRYSDTNPLGERELLGELEQACQRDAAIELWILGATRSANEQLQNSLFESGRKQGVPVLVIDWAPSVDAPALAALCAMAPEIVREIAGDAAADTASRISTDAGVVEASTSLVRDMQAWNVGLNAVAESSRKWLERLWNSAAASVAALGQDAAGGAEKALVVRAGIHGELDAWWQGSTPDAPAVLVGEEGMGKTWAGVGWLTANLAEFPVVVVVPSGMVTQAAGSATGLRDLIGSRLHEVTGVRDAAFWSARAERMLRRPDTEGPVFLLMLDGMNQEPRAPWLPLIQNLQVPPFAGKVRVIASTRPLSFEGELRSLRRLVVPAVRIDVGPYDDTPGGEFDTILALHGLLRSDIRNDLIPLARIPRLLELVIRLKDSVSGVGRITIHGLLWEYGRDTLGPRGGRAFTEPEWRAWLAEIASRFLTLGSVAVSMRDLEAATARPSLDPTQIQARLSDIVDGQVADADALGGVVLRPEIVAQALGVAVIAELERAVTAGQTDVTTALDNWLGPIAGFTERSEILRAAVAIAASPSSKVARSVSDALVAAWISGQNLPDDHRRDVAAIAPSILPSLLMAVEALTSQSLAAAREMAIDATRSIPRSDGVSRNIVCEFFTRWMATVSREADQLQSRSDEGERHRAGRMVARTGSDMDGRRHVLGRELTFVSSTDGHAYAQVPALIDGYPLEPFLDLFELAALQLAIRGHFPTWASLEWLTLWNDKDFDATAAALRTRASEVLDRPVETGIEPRLRDRVAALLLWLTSDPADEAQARALDPRLDAFHSYEADYEANPGTSMFSLERRHAETVMADTTLTPQERMRKLEGFWWDPSLSIPDLMIDAVRAVADRFEVGRLSTGGFRNADDLDLDHLEAALARCSPPALAKLVRRRIAALATIEDGRLRLGQAGYEALLVGDEATMSLLADEADRLASAAETEDDGARQLLLQPAIVDLPGEAQVEALIGANLANLYTNVNPFLAGLDAEAVDRLIARHRGAPVAVARRLIELISVMVTALSDDAAAWLTGLAFDEAFDRQVAAFDALARCRPDALCAELLARDWSWDRAKNDYSAHYGSIAIIRATASLPLDQVADRIAPWLIASAARERGGAPAEVRMAAQILDQVVRREAAESPDPGSQLSVDEARRSEAPFVYSVTPAFKSDGDEIVRINGLMDQDAREAAARRAVKVAKSRIRSARAGGASLYLASFDPNDLAPIIAHAEDIVEGWCAGMTETSDSFRRRVRLAEGFYISLVEATMRVRIERGVNLWRAVRASLTTKFIGTAGIDRMILILLAAPADSDVDDLVRELLSPLVSTNDETLLQLAVAAAAAGREALLTQISSEDRSSGIIWRIERGKTVGAFSPGVDAAPIFTDGRARASEIRDGRRGEILYRDAAAHHWWNAYWSADSGQNAYAFWALFKRSAGRRALEWTRRQWPPKRGRTGLELRKWLYAYSQLDELKRVGEEREKKFAGTLYLRKTVDDVRPWSRMGPVNGD